MNRLGVARICLVLATSLAATCSPSVAQSLREILNEHAIPVDSPRIQNLDEKITSFAVLDNPSNFVIAYYLDDGSRLLRPPLFVFRYAKEKPEWTTVALRGVEADFPGLSGAKQDCLGAALRIHESGEFLFIDTHKNPSAGCVLALARNLALKKALSGWYLAAFRSGRLVFHRSQVHFAPVHPMEIAVYDLQHAFETQIYPPRSDPIRAAHVGKYSAAVPAEQWCRNHNSPCDPSQFSSRLHGSVVINEETDSLAFVAQMEPPDFVRAGAGEQAATRIEQVVYVFLFSQGSVAHREFRLSKMKALLGTESIEALLTRPMLERIFVGKRP